MKTWSGVVVYSRVLVPQMPRWITLHRIGVQKLLYCLKAAFSNFSGIVRFANVCKMSDGLLNSHVDVRYKHSLLKTMLNRAFKLSSNWQFFHRGIVNVLQWSPALSQNPLREHQRHFIEMKVTENECSKQQVSDEQMRCSHQNCLTVQRPEIGECGKTPAWWSQSAKDWCRCPVCLHSTSQKIKGQFKPKEHKLPIVNQSASRVDTYFNLWRNMNDQQSAIA